MFSFSLTTYPSVIRLFKIKIVFMGQVNFILLAFTGASLFSESPCCPGFRGRAAGRGPKSGLFFEGPTDVL